MNPSLAKTLVPSVIYFVVLFIVFTILELIIISVVEKLEHKHRDTIMRNWENFQKHHHNILIAVEIVGVILLAIALNFMWPILKGTAQAPEATLFIAGLVLVIALIYFFITHTKTRLRIRKRGDKYLYLILNVLVYFILIVVINQRFSMATDLINENLTTPVLEAIEERNGEAAESKLLEDATAMIKAGECEDFDYEALDDGILRHFMFAGKDLELAISPPATNPDNPSHALKGRRCNVDGNMMILNKFGDWHLVIEQSSSR